MRAVDVLAEREQDRQATNARMRMATITALDDDTGTVTIQLGGASLPGVNHLAGFYPYEGAIVVVLQTASQLLVLGPIAGPNVAM